MQIGCTHVFPCWPVSCNALSFAINLYELDISCNSGMQSPPAGEEWLRRSWKMYCWESFNFLVAPFWSVLTFQCIHIKQVWSNSWAENVVSWDISCSDWHAPFMWWQSWIFLRHSVLETNWTITWCSDYTQRWFSACSLSLQPLHFHRINCTIWPTHYLQVLLNPLHLHNQLFHKGTRLSFHCLILPYLVDTVHLYTRCTWRT